MTEEPRTDPAELSKHEQAKQDEPVLRETMCLELAGTADDVPFEIEQLLKPYGIYLEYDRAIRGAARNWIYMLRLGLPGGHRITREQWALLHDLSERFSVHPDGSHSLRLTTRGNIQFHWLKKPALLTVVRELAESNLFSRNACGDNVRNVACCPLSGPDDADTLFDGAAMAADLTRHFRLPDGPYVQVFGLDPDRLQDDQPSFDYGRRLLGRKLKIGLASIRLNSSSGALARDNCVEVRTQDIGLVPLLSRDRVDTVQVFVGGGQGEKRGKPTASMFSLPFARVLPTQVIPVLDAIVGLHRDLCDRSDRNHARLKYVVRDVGLESFFEQVQERSGIRLGAPLVNLQTGPRRLHHGWVPRGTERFAFGLFVENGRVTDHSPNGRIKSLVSELMNRFDVTVSVTPNQDLVFHGLRDGQRGSFGEVLTQFGYGARHGRPYSRLRLNSGACVGLDTCRLAVTESEKFEPALIDELERRGFADVDTSIGITGCERQCFRPATKAIGLVGSGKERYGFKLFGTEDAGHQGVPLEVGGVRWLESVSRDRVADVIEQLLLLHRNAALPDESVGNMFRRLGPRRILMVLARARSVADLVEGWDGGDP